MLFSSNPCMYVILYQGPRSNFEIGEGWGGTISHSILGGTKHFFLKYWGGGFGEAAVFALPQSTAY